MSGNNNLRNVCKKLSIIWIVGFSITVLSFIIATILEDIKDFVIITIGYEGIASIVRSFIIIIVFPLAFGIVIWLIYQSINETNKETK